MGYDWRFDAACVGYDPELWYPVSGTGPQANAALAVCARCPVKAPCLAFAVDNAIDFGIWGGVPAQARIGPGKRPRRGAGSREATLRPCGTPAAYLRHKRRGEAPCAVCLAAEASRYGDHPKAAPRRQAG